MTKPTFATISSVAPGSPAARAHIAPGDRLVSINGRRVGDILDYRFLSADEDLLLELHTPSGGIKLISLYNPDCAPLDLEFSEPLISPQRSCANNCVFCFIDQNPKGMRETIYYKDDDTRLSFLQGNYVTLTNLTEGDIDRIIEYRISPLNVSVHTLNPELRQTMLRGKNAGTSVAFIKRLAENGIRLNCQLVLCPGLNDGAELERTLSELYDMIPNVASVSVVPVGLTKHRAGLYPLRLFTGDEARAVVKTVERFRKSARDKCGDYVFAASDEFLRLSGLSFDELGGESDYDGYPQLENGVGMFSLFAEEFFAAKKKQKKPAISEKSVILTGLASYEFIEYLLQGAGVDFEQLRVVPVKNNFFGETVTVSGLLAGSDFREVLRKMDYSEHTHGQILIPQNAVRRGEDVFLDDLTVRDLETKFGTKIRLVSNGDELYRAIQGRK
jgi:putative radical SAM enzyme (TIGR03279 family)